MIDQITTFFKKFLPRLPKEDSFVSVVTELAELTHQSKAEVLRDAINMYYAFATLPEQDLLALQSLLEDLSKKQAQPADNDPQRVIL